MYVVVVDASRFVPRHASPEMEDVAQSSTENGSLRVTLELRAGSTPLSGTAEWSDGRREFVGLLDLMNVIRGLTAQPTERSALDGEPDGRQS